MKEPLIKYKRIRKFLVIFKRVIRLVLLILEVVERLLKLIG